jgi:hypothetical protein
MLLALGAVVLQTAAFQPSRRWSIRRKAWSRNDPRSRWGSCRDQAGQNGRDDHRRISDATKIEREELGPPCRHGHYRHGSRLTIKAEGVRDATEISMRNDTLQPDAFTIEVAQQRD